MKEFDCAECGRHIISIVPSGFEPLCGMCVHSPGWFSNPELRALLDPTYDGKDQLANVPLWEPPKKEG